MLRLVTPPGATATGTLAVGSPVVTGIADTAPLAGALAVTGTGVPRGTFVESIDDVGQITLTQAATVDGAQTLTFTLEPVMLAEARVHLRQTDTTEDALIARLISAARRLCEKDVRRTFLTSTWDYSLDVFPWSYVPFAPRSFTQYPYEAEVRIPNPPLVSVTSFSYVDTGGSTLVLSGSAYGFRPGTPGVLVPAYGTIWPFVRGLPGDVVVRYVAGYGTAADVPEEAKAAILMRVGYLYDNRGDVDAPTPAAVAELLSSLYWGSYG